MKKLLTILSLLAMFCFWSCENSEREHGNGKDEEQVESMSIAVFIQDEEFEDSCYDVWSRLSLRGQDWCMVEIVDEAMVDVPIFLFGDAKTQEGVLVTAYEDYAYLMSYNPCLPETPNSCIVLCCDDNNIFIQPYNIDWENNEMVEDETAIAIPINHDKLSSFEVTRADSYDNEIRKKIYDLFTKLQTSVEEQEEIVGDLIHEKHKEKISLVYKIWSKIAAPIAKMQLYSDDEEVLKQMYEDEKDAYIKSQLINFAMPHWWGIMKKWTKRAFWLLSYGEDENIDNYEDVYDEEKHESFLGGKLGDDALERFMRITSYMSSKLRQLKHSDKSIPNTNEGYEVSAQVELVGVDDDNAYIRGYYTCENEQMASIEQMGFVYHRNYGEKIEVVVDNFDSTLQLLDLYWNTQYYVCAFVIANGKRYESSTISFITEPYYGVTPSDLFFGVEGDSIGVSVSLSANGEYRIIDYPEWCVICEGEEVFFVDVSPCESERSGVITVEFLGLNGMRYIEEVSVRQKNMYGWNNTEWKLEGMETYTDKNGKISQQKMFLTVKIAPNSITTSNSDIYISSPFTFHNKEYSFGDNGDLIVEMNYKQSDGYSEVVSESTLVLRRKDHSNILWSLAMFEHMEYFYSDSYSHYDIEAEGTGTLVVE